MTSLIQIEFSSSSYEKEHVESSISEESCIESDCEVTVTRFQGKAEVQSSDNLVKPEPVTPNTLDIPHDDVFIAVTEQEPPEKARQMQTWDFSFTVKHTLKGPRIHFEMSQNGLALFHSKLKSRHQTFVRRPIGISRGSESHFSQTDFAGVIHMKGKSSFSLVENDKETMMVDFKPAKKNFPKDIFVTMSEQKLNLVNAKPRLNAQGHWTLPFGGKTGIPSVKNCVLVNKDDTGDKFIFMRRTSDTKCEIDSDGRIPPICLFAYGVCVFVSPI